MKRSLLKGKLLAAGISLVLCGCAAASAPRINRPPQVSHLVSSWERGTCSLRGANLNYGENDSQRQLSLDMHPIEAQHIICSRDHTVILSRNAAIVSLGGDGVLSGREMLGSLDGDFVAANSYSLNISCVQDEGIARARLIGDDLEFSTDTGRHWRINLHNPRRGWDIY